MRPTRTDPITGDTEQQCLRCGEWWPLAAGFYYRFSGKWAPTCNACYAETTKRPPRKRVRDVKVPQHPPVAKGVQPARAWDRTISGMHCTATMFMVLEYLVDAQAKDWPYIALDQFHKRTINSLLARKWIRPSPGIDGLKYAITDDGKRAHKIFSRPPKRTDGICPTCGIRPRHVSTTGYKHGWCIECEREYKSFRYHKRLDRMNPNRLCSACKQRPLHRYKGGKLSTYCTECRHAQRKAEKRAQHDRDLARIAAGEILLCRACKKEPRAHTERYVRDRCPACQKIYMDEYNARRRSAVQV